MSIIQGTSKAAGGAGYQINQSIRFNDGDSPYLNRTFGTPTSSSQFGYSFWVKLGADYDGKYIISANGGGNNDNFTFSSGQIIIQEGGVLRLRSTQLFRDFSSWYHFVVAYDLGNATASQKLRVYLNGSEITSWSTDTRSSLSSTSSRLNAAVSHDVGANVFNGVSSHINNWDGYIAEFHFVDGAVLTPTDFGKYNDAGVWIPIAASPTYGNNGFYITGATASDLGEDFSGNNNDYTSSGLATTDQMLDTPTDNYCVMNPLDAPTGSITLANGNLDLNQSSFNKVRGTIAFDVQDDDGFYFEVKKTNGNFRSAGIVSTDASNFASAQSLLSVNPSVVYYMEGGEVNQNGSQVLASLPTFATNDVLGVAVRNGKVYFAKNNTWVNSGDPVNETGQVASITGSSPLYSPAVGEQNNQSGITNTVNFGATAFAYTPPTGYKKINTSTLLTPSIKDGSAYFQTTLYTGTGSSQAVTQSGNSTFQPDWVWIKGRSGATEHVLTDAVRGVTKEISSNDAGAEETVAQGLTTFGSSGFTVGTDGSYNTGSATYVGWQWKANGAGSSNTDGSITSTVSANITAGFSIVKYTGTGANATVGHGLGGLVPKMIFIKDTTNVESWIVYNETVGNDGNLYLNLTNAKATQAIFQNTTPTSSVFYLGTLDGANKASGVHVAYCFAEIPGYSSIGSYTGNSSTDGPFVYTGFKPAFVMFKVSTNAPTGWAIIDNKRSNPFNPTDGLLQPDQSSTEGTSDKWDILSNGFKVRTTWAAVNGSGYTVTYMAFAENPFGGDGVAPATAR